MKDRHRVSRFLLRWPAFWLLHAIWNFTVARNQDRFVASVVLDQRGRLGGAYAAAGVLCLLTSLDPRAGYLAAPLSAAAKLVIFLPVLLDAFRGRSPGTAPLATATIETALSVACIYFLWVIDVLCRQPTTKHAFENTRKPCKTNAQGSKS